MYCLLYSKAFTHELLKNAFLPDNTQWAEVDSNHRSKLQQIYSLSPLATRESTHMKFYCLPTDIIQINCLMQADDRTRTDNLLITNQLLCQLSHIGINDPDGNRTRVTAVKGRCLNRLTTEPYLYSFIKKTPRVGLEPTTARLTAACSTN